MGFLTFWFFLQTGQIHPDGPDATLHGRPLGSSPSDARLDNKSEGFLIKHVFENHFNIVSCLLHCDLVEVEQPQPSLPLFNVPLQRDNEKKSGI